MSFAVLVKRVVRNSSQMCRSLFWSNHVGVVKRRLQFLYRANVSENCDCNWQASKNNGRVFPFAGLEGGCGFGFRVSGSGFRFDLDPDRRVALECVLAAQEFALRVWSLGFGV